MAGYLLSHDLGTSADKATLYTPEGELLGSSLASYPVEYSLGGRGAEQDPALWWEAFCCNNRALLKGIDPADVAAVSVSGQMMACLPVNKAGEPLRPCMIWADTRSEEEEKALKEALGFEAYYGITGNAPSAAYTAEKILYLKKHEPEIFKQAHLISGTGYTHDGIPHERLFQDR